MNIYEDFKNFVRKKHCRQKYDGKDYMYHLEGVCGILDKYLGMHPRINSLKMMGLGHDLFENTDAEDQEVLKYVSSDVVQVMYLLTDKEGENRKERHLNTYYLIKEKEEAVIVKLCDRIFHLNQKKIKSCYFKEKDTFKFALFDPRHSYARILWEVYDSKFTTRDASK